MLHHSIISSSTSTHTWQMYVIGGRAILGHRGTCSRFGDREALYLFKIEIVHKSTQKYKKNNKILSSKFAYPSPDTEIQHNSSVVWLRCTNWCQALTMELASSYCVLNNKQENTLDCDQSNVYSSCNIFSSISPNLPLCSFSLAYV